MKILRSFEEFLFEATSWLAFYPLTLWRVVTRPLTWMDYSDAEQSDEGEGRYDRALSPPLLLLITVVLLNLIGTATHSAPPAEASLLLHAVNRTPENQALFRALIFSLLPLLAAVIMLRGQQRPLSRETLRAPFYAQCYLAAPCAMIVNAGIFIFANDDISNALGVAVIVGGAAWFLTAQTRWFAARLKLRTPKAALLALASTLAAITALFAILFTAMLVLST